MSRINLNFIRNSFKIQLAFWGIVIILFIQLLNAIILINSKKIELANDIYNNANAYAKLTTNKMVEYYLHYHNSGYFKLYNLIDELLTLNEDIEMIYIYKTDGDIVLHPNDFKNRKKPTIIKIPKNSKIFNRLELVEISSDFYIINERKKIDIVSPHIDEWGRHTYSVRYIFNYKSLDKKILKMKNEIIVISLISLFIAIILFIIFAIKITSRITELLKEKELLLREVYHRVKNNFQIVISLLSLDSPHENEEERNFDIINRIKSMSLIHEYLLDSKKFSQIKSREYLLRIINENQKLNINIDSKIDSCILNIDQAMALGIITNEVLNNALKHHPEKNRCIISLNFKKSKNFITLTIKDNGLGFIPPKYTESFGLEMINEFTSKLKSSNIEFIKNNGTTFILKFEL